MAKAVINTCYGGFDLSQEACKWLFERNFPYIYEQPEYFLKVRPNIRYGVDVTEIPRHHPLLIECVETLKDNANGIFSELAVVEFNGDKYRITNYDGLESIETPDTEPDWVDANKH